MNPIRKLNTNEGVVLITVVIVVIVTMILAVSLIGIAVSQNISNQHQIERIQAEQVAKGIMWNNYMNLYPGAGAVPNGIIPLDGRNYVYTINPGPVGTGPNGTDPFAIQVTCPLCQ